MPVGKKGAKKRELSRRGGCQPSGSEGYDGKVTKGYKRALTLKNPHGERKRTSAERPNRECGAGVQSEGHVPRGKKKKNWTQPQMLEPGKKLPKRNKKGGKTPGAHRASKKEKGNVSVREGGGNDHSGGVF